MEEQQSILDLQLDNQAVAHLGETAKWARFLAIVGFVLIGLIVVGAFFAGTIIASFSAVGAGPLAALGGGFITVIYLIVAAIWFFPNLFLYQFATRTRKAIQTNDSTVLTNAFSAQKSLFKFAGIVTIIYLAFIALGLIFGIVGGAMRA